jgi:Domain of unknown function (DUF4430)
MEPLVRGRPGRAIALIAALLAAGALAAGCGERRSQEPPASGEAAATIAATADYGAVQLLDVRVEPGQSVMRALRGATDVETAYGGGFVAGMLGRESDPGASRDWFFFVDGVSASVSAEQVELSAGQSVWWDFRDWGALMDTPAVVGMWPTPFAGPGAARGPVAADPPLAAALEEAGAVLADGDSPWRARVGESAELARRDPAWRRALDDPDRAGLTVAIEDGRVVAFGPDADERRPVAGARALVAAVPTGLDPGDGALLAVAGLDAAAARAAAETVADDPAVLRLRYAVAFDGGGAPLVAGGRAGP